jgi:hypothetical protein
MDDRPVRDVLLVLAAPLLALVLSATLAVALALLTAPARAHSWYPFECCSDRDCWPMGEGGREPEPVAGPGGWRLASGEVVAYREARPSPDGRFHVCRRAGQADGALIAPVGRPACLFVPPTGS